MDPHPTIEIRAATAEDHPAIIALASAALGWRPGEPNEALFRWKHVDNPVGPSPMWVAVDGDRLAGFRAFLRWSFDDPHLGPQAAIRAVDTATHPDYQGQGVFTALTRHGLAAAHAEGIDFVFNTPNDQSRPGYLKMGWQVVGRVPIGVTVTSVGALARMVRARVAADKWSLATEAGRPAPEVLADRAGLDALVASLAPPAGLRTRRSPEFLAWRYGLDALRYRAVTVGDRVEGGVALFRVRRRGAAVEATLADVLVPGGDRRLARALVTRVREATHPDYLVCVQRPLVDRRSVRLPGQGPLLTWRAVNRATKPELAHWELAMTDIELF